MANIDINYQPELTPERLHNSSAFIRGIMGPRGSGKSVCIVNELLDLLIAQEPSPRDGIRKSRALIVRNTFSQLKSTTIKTWEDWIPSEMGRVVYSSTITCNLKFKLDDGSLVHSEVWFIPMDKMKDIRKLLSFEVTFAWLNEVREIPEEVFEMIQLSVGRYPMEEDGFATRDCILMDTNACDDSHYYYRFAEVLKPDNMEFFRQPPALLWDKEREKWVGNEGQGDYPPAENVSHLKGGFEYWLKALPGKSNDWIRVYILNEYGTTQEGKPVFPEYKDAVHCSDTGLDLYKGLPLLLGWDFGLAPCCIFAQLTPHGQLRVIDELVTNVSEKHLITGKKQHAIGMGLEQFLESAFLPYLNEHYKGMVIHSWGDTIGGGQRSQVDMRTCLALLEKNKIPTGPAPNYNSLIARRDSVTHFLTRNDGEQNPAFQLSHKCTMLRKGFRGGYHFSRVQVVGEKRFRDMPNKNEFSHPQDGLQAITLGVNSPNVISSASQAREVKQMDARGWT